MPRVSVVLPFRNAEPYLAQAIDSILSQECRDLELILVDDGSADRSTATARLAARRDSRVRNVTAGGSGLPTALNLGIAEASGEYIARMDADDVALPARLALQAAALDHEPDLVVIGSAVDQVDSLGRLIEPVWYPTDPAVVASTLSGGACCLCHPATMMRRNALVAAGGYRASVAMTEDFDLWLRMLRVGTIRNLDRRLLQYRLHGESVAFTCTRQQIISYLRSAALHREAIDDAERRRIDASTDLDALVRAVEPSREPAEVFLDFFEWYVERAAMVSSTRVVIRLAGELARFAPGGRRRFVEQTLRESAAVRAASLGRHTAAWLLLMSRSHVPAQRRAAWLAVLRPPVPSVLEGMPAQLTAPSGYLDRLSVVDDGSQLVLDGWVPVSNQRLPSELAVLAPSGSRVQGFRLKRRADVARAIGPEHLYSGFRAVVRLGQQLTRRDPIPVVFTKSAEHAWRPLHQDNTLVDWGYRPGS